MTDEKDLDFWTDYYVKNPHMLRDFIKTANEQAGRMAKELGENEAEIERLRAVLTSLVGLCELGDGSPEYFHLEPPEMKEARAVLNELQPVDTEIPF